MASCPRIPWCLSFNPSREERVTVNWKEPRRPDGSPPTQFQQPIQVHRVRVSVTLNGPTPLYDVHFWRSFFSNQHNPRCQSAKNMCFRSTNIKDETRNLLSITSISIIFLLYHTWSFKMNYLWRVYEMVFLNVQRERERGESLKYVYTIYVHHVDLKANIAFFVFSYTKKVKEMTGATLIRATLKPL